LIALFSVELKILRKTECLYSVQNGGISNLCLLASISNQTVLLFHFYIRAFTLENIQKLFFFPPNSLQNQFSQYIKSSSNHLIFSYTFQNLRQLLDMK